MNSKDKMIGTALIIIGLIFIALGVYVMQMSNRASALKTQTNSNNAQDNQQVEVYYEQTQVEVYTENTNNTNNETTVIERYVY